MAKEEKQELETIANHRARARSDGISVWYIQTPRRRKIEIQEYKRRLFLVGKLYDGFRDLLPFEAPVGLIRKRFGPITT